MLSTEKASRRNVGIAMERLGIVTRGGAVARRGKEVRGKGIEWSRLAEQ